MDTDDAKLVTVLRAIGEGAKVVIVTGGVAWEAHLDNQWAYTVSATCRPMGTRHAEWIKREFDIREIDDIATIVEEAFSPADLPQDDLNELSKELLRHAEEAGDPLVEKALRNAQRYLMDAEVQQAKGQRHGGQRHRPTPPGGNAVSGIDTFTFNGRGFSVNGVGVDCSGGD